MISKAAKQRVIPVAEKLIAKVRMWSRALLWKG